MTYFIGVDLGGTHIRAALLNLDNGEAIAFQKVKTPALDGPLTVVKHIANLIDEIVLEGKKSSVEIGGVGIGVPGLLDMDAGRVLRVPNLPGEWQDIPVAQLIHESSGLPVLLLNDVRAITLGEHVFGAGRGADTMVCYAIGTGIGGGIIINGRLHLGLSGSAGEIGHQVVEINGIPCNCGGRGCLELYAAGPAIAAQAVQAVVRRRATMIGDMVDNDLNRITTEVVLQAARQGDQLACELFEQAGAYLGMSIANTILTISPQKVVIGGGVAAAGELLLNPVRRMVRERVFMAPVEHVEIVLAELGDRAGLLGVALWASQNTK